MKRFYYLNSLFLFLGLLAFNLETNAQNTFRINYDIANFDLAGGVVETPGGNYLFSGTNATFLPLFGNLFEVDQAGNIVWANGYAAGIATEFSDIKNISTGGYIVSGATSPGLMLMNVANGGGVNWANSYQTTNGNSEGGARVIETSDGGFLSAGRVYSYDPAGPPTILDSANLYIVKTNSAGTLLWDKIVFVTTAFDNDHTINDMAEVADGYVFVGTLSDSNVDPDNGGSSSGVIFKTDFAGNMQWINRLGTIGSSQTANSAYTLSNGEVLVSGVYDADLMLLRVNSAGTITWSYQYDAGGGLFPNTAEGFDAFETNDGKYAMLGTYIDFSAFPAFSIGSFLLKTEPANANLIFERSYLGGLSTILPEGIQVSDSGYTMGMMAQQITGFNYHLIKTDPTGNLLDPTCTPGVVSFANTAFSPSFVAITPNEYSGSTRTGFVPVVSNLTPTKVVDCQTIICTPPTNPTASATSTTICAGASTTINGAGSGAGVVYDVYTTPTGGASIGTTPLVVSPGVTTTYYVEAVITATSCPSAIRDPITITVNPLPTVTANATTITICNGDPVTLTGGGATSYTWDNGVTDGVPFNPSTTTTYTVTGTDANTCQNTAQITITVNPVPTVVANATTITICNGDPVTLTGSGATSYTWDNGVTDGVPFNPSATTTYTVTGTTGGCSNTDQITVTVNPLPTVTANATTITICNGDPVTLTGSGATSYTWDNGVTDGVPFNPSATTTYTVTGTDGNSCQNTAQITVTVNPLPTVTANAAPASTVCQGDPVTLTGGGATSYTWDNGVTDGLAFTPAGSLLYTVTGTDGNSCQNTDTITVSVISIPTVVANATTTTICNGDPVTLTGSGATSYTWDNGVTDGVPFNPGSTLTYTVTGSTGSCSNTDQITITVNPLPTVTANATSITICNGDPVTLTGGGATSYTWDNGVTDGVPFNPSATTTYTVTGTDGNSCQNTAQITVTVNPLPTVTANATNTTICDGDPVTLTGGGATSYTWDNGVTDGVPFNPSATTTYTVTGTDGNSCQNTAQITVTVNPLPTVTATALPDTIVCLGDPVTLAGGGATSYTWDNGVTDGVPFNPLVSTTYTVTGTDGNSCQNTAQINVTVVTLPVVTANAVPSATICQGDTMILNGGGATTYTWDNGVTDGVAFVPAGTLLYTVTGTVGASCSNTDTITIFVNSLPTVTASSTDTVICQGDQITLTGTGGSSYTWDNGVTDGVAFTPTGTTTYTVTGTDANTCSSTAQLTITVNPLPTINVTGTNSICNGDSTLLTATGGITYTWNTSDTTAVISVTPVTTTTYTATGTDANGCQNTGQITVTVLAPPNAAIAGTNSSCSGDIVNLTASGGGTYVWDTGDTTTIISVNPNDTTTYTLIATIGSCVDTTTFTVNVNPIPTVILTPNPDTTIMLGQSADLNAAGGTSYSWTPNNDLSCSTCPNPNATPDITTTYCVSVTNNACTDTSCVTVIVDVICGEVFVPTAFSPNGDGSNDCLQVYNNCIESMVFRVYARWGEVVFEATDVSECWDGSFKGKDLNNAVFVYTLEATLINGEEVSQKGNVSLIR